MEEFENNTRIRPESSYTSADKSEIRLLSFGEYGFEEPFPFGSASYVIQKYPGDLDLNEQLIAKGPPGKVVKEIARYFQQVVSRVVDKGCHWVTDIKAGVDMRYDIDIGELVNGEYKINEIGLEKMISMISDEDANEILEIITSKLPDMDKYDSICKIVREYRIIRWSAVELLNGRKRKNGRNISLVEALSMASQCKIDCVSKLGDRFVETTNMIYIGTVYENDLYIINTDYDFTNNVEIITKYEDNMKDEIEKLFYSNVWGNAFKGAKRMWAYSRVRKDVNTNNLLSPIISGGLSALYQVKSEIETILLVENDSEYSSESKMCIKRDMNKRCDSWKNSISHVLELSDSIMKVLFSLVDNRDLELLSDTIKKVVNEMCVNKMRKVGLYPISYLYLPSKRKYC